MAFSRCRERRRGEAHGFRLLLIVWLMGLSCTVHALDARHIAMQGNGRGAAACAACHGANGAGQPAAGFPYLAGLNARYLRRQLDAMADGTRAAPVMRPIALALSPEERAALAVYYSRMRNRLQSAPPVARVTLGAALATRGRWPRQLPACDQCHGPQGRGAGEHFPPLAGQPAAYLSAQLQAFQQGLRRDDPMGLMRHVATQLNPAEVAAGAAWYAAQPTGAAVPATPVMDATLADAGAHDISSSGRTMPVFTPPDETQMPAGPLGDAVRQGRAIFLHTRDYAPAYARNALSCGNCHLDAGRHADSAPLWAAYVRYPIYSRKSWRVDTFGERLQECFRFSLNGGAPPLDSPVLVALESYARWLATGAPVGAALPGAGYPKADQPPPQPPDYHRGAQI
jgi:thiosulfate dehydrogenase